jgi:hypothetical protein
MTHFTPKQLLVIRYLRGLGLQHSEIAEHMGVSRQVIGYQLKKLRSAFIHKDSLPGLKQAGGISPLVGYVSAPCLPSLECDWCSTEPNAPDREANYSCPTYAEHAAYAQLEDLPKHQRIAVLLALLQGVELE